MPTYWKEIVIQTKEKKNKIKFNDKHDKWIPLINMIYTDMLIYTLCFI